MIEGIFIFIIILSILGIADTLKKPDVKSFYNKKVQGTIKPTKNLVSSLTEPKQYFNESFENLSKEEFEYVNELFVKSLKNANFGSRIALMIIIVLSIIGFFIRA